MTIGPTTYRLDSSVAELLPRSSVSRMPPFTPMLNGCPIQTAAVKAEVTKIEDFTCLKDPDKQPSPTRAMNFATIKLTHEQRIPRSRLGLVCRLPAFHDLPRSRPRLGRKAGRGFDRIS